MASPKLGRDLLANSAAQNEVLANEWLLILEALSHPVIPAGGFQLNTPPGSGTEVLGGAYITGASPTDAWAGKPNHVAIALAAGQWRFVDLASYTYLVAWNTDTAGTKSWQGGAWV